VEPDLYRLVFRAGNTLWADDADLEFGCGSRPAFRQRHGPLELLGERRSRCPALWRRSTSWVGPVQTPAPGEHRHKQRGQPRNFYRKLHIGFLPSRTVLGFVVILGYEPHNMAFCRWIGSVIARSTSRQGFAAAVLSSLRKPKTSRPASRAPAAGVPGRRNTPRICRFSITSGGVAASNLAMNFSKVS
jgi:hypothetical protein